MFRLISSIIVLLVFYTNAIFAENKQYKLGEPRLTQVYNTYPSLDFFGTVNVEIKATSNLNENTLTPERLELNFQNANKFVARNFRLIGDNYRAVVQNAWVFRQVMVELNSVDLMNGQLNLKLYVVENMSQIDSISESFGPELLGLSGPIVDITPNPVADSLNVRYQDKRLQLKLLKNPVYRGPEIGFEIKSMWHGHGEQVLYVPIYNGQESSITYKAISFTVEKIDVFGELMDYLTINYVDLEGQNYADTAPLSQFIEAAYSSN